MPPESSRLRAGPPGSGNIPRVVVDPRSPLTRDPVRCVAEGCRRYHHQSPNDLCHLCWMGLQIQTSLGEARLTPTEENTLAANLHDWQGFLDTRRRSRVVRSGKAKDADKEEESEDVDEGPSIPRGERALPVPWGPGGLAGAEGPPQSAERGRPPGMAVGTTSKRQAVDSPKPSMAPRRVG